MVDTTPGEAEDAEASAEADWGWGMWPSFYEGVGHVVTMAASLEFFMVRLAQGLAPEDRRDWQKVQSQPGQPLKALRSVTSQLPAGRQTANLVAFAREADAALQERGRVTHSLHNVYTRRYPEEAKWFSHYPRDNAWTAVPTVAELNDLAGRLRTLAQRAIILYPGPESMPLRSDSS
jgi:hypothetical protein